MKYFDVDKFNKGKRFINIGIAILVLFTFTNLIAKILRKDTLNIIGDIINPCILLIVIAFYYKGNKIAFKIISFIVTFLWIIPALLIFSITFYLLRPLGILNMWGGALFLIIPIAYISAVCVLIIKIGWFECIEEYRLYRNENKTN
jgi:hypothetical protein